MKNANANLAFPDEPWLHERRILRPLLHFCWAARKVHPRAGAFPDHCDGLSV